MIRRPDKTIALTNLVTADVDPRLLSRTTHRWKLAECRGKVRESSYKFQNHSSDNQEYENEN